MMIGFLCVLCFAVLLVCFDLYFVKSSNSCTIKPYLGLLLGLDGILATVAIDDNFNGKLV